MCRIGSIAMNKELTNDQKIILTGYTGILMCEFSMFYFDVEKRLNRTVYTHEFSSLKDEIKKLYEKDFLAICGVEQ